jgi:hypothetical protein
MADQNKLEARRDELRVCNRAAKLDFSLNPDLFRAMGPGIPETRWARYQRVGHFAHMGMVFQNGDQLTDRVSDTAKSGFAVLARLLFFAPVAYRQYCAENDVAPSVDEIRASLKQSHDTPATFMNVPHATCGMAEEAFNLGARNEPYNESPHLRFEDSDEGLVFVADAEHFANNTMIQYENGMPHYWQRCPAKRLAVERLWPAMIDLAADAPECFAYDLATADSLDV